MAENLGAGSVSSRLASIAIRITRVNDLATMNDCRQRIDEFVAAVQREREVRAQVAQGNASDGALIQASDRVTFALNRMETL